MGKTWEDGPWKVISGVENGAKNPQVGLQYLLNDMIIIHNIVIRSINAIYLQCVNIEKGSPGDITDFMAYCAEFYHLIDDHHLSEEEDVFPGIEQLIGEPGFMDRSVQQHHAFLPGLGEFLEYVRAVRDGKEKKYDGGRLRALIDAFMPIMYDHLCDEIVVLKGLKKYEDKVDWDKYWREKSAEITARNKAGAYGMKVFAPFCISGHDAAFENGVFQWPPMPWVAKLVFRFWFSPVHKAWWRFAPCDASSKVQTLPFA
ncbi:hemerythrin HHE cation binding domain-containing protein [Xylariaceae sp. FL0662B]|nr:hemerythrin HHE cation binding domain-containing protein [Xylariaceae sp. FL0662B]